MRVKVQDLKVNDYVDLESTPVSKKMYGADFEYGCADNIEWESAECVRDFTNFDSVVYPVDEMVEIDEDQRKRVYRESRQSASKPVKVVYIAMLIEDGGDAWIDDAINETLRETQQKSPIIDYAFNCGGNCPELPEAIPATIDGNYCEGGLVQIIEAAKQAKSFAAAPPLGFVDNDHDGMA